MANPVLQEKAFDYELRNENEGTMTLNGAINKSIMLTLILMLSAMVSVFFVLAKRPDMLYPAALVSSIGAFVLALIMTFKKELAKVFSILYAILEGVAIGAVSYIFNAVYEGIVVQAVFLTFLDLFIMLILYRFRIIRVTDKLRSVITVSTLCIGIVYLINFIMSFFGMRVPFLYGSSPLSIGISIVIVLIASFNLLLDFDFMEKGEEYNMPKYFEWYAAFGLLVTLVWLYLEILKLLAKVRNRD
ncbi:Bax inhibitor-1/YccA family protein [uncultured Brachyspira sp.]|uniref:Bax inhibitor-1/YccA family protein n=1 Tax=uncultured Brachyspira sp. TaxID=221953 RepID=UPI0025DE7790|nr:Bax inhibitor-1/YccA family protein [uncultured Brachyspira sp.]